MTIRRPHHDVPDVDSSPPGSSVPSVTLRLLTSSDLTAFRALRLEALRRHPEAFVPTYDEERSVNPRLLPDDMRLNWICNGNFLLGAFVDSRLVGVVGVQRWTRYKQRHKATIWIFYTDSSIRGQGIGRQLLLMAINRCQSMTDLEVLQLSVGAESVSARKLYTSLGFVAYGCEPHGLKLDDRAIDVEFMALRLRNAPSLSAVS